MLSEIEREQLRYNLANYKLRELEFEPWKGGTCFGCSFWSYREMIDTSLMFGSCEISRAITSNMSRCPEFRRAVR